MDAAQQLLLRQGFSGTGIEQICREAGVARGSFFHYFATKTDLGVAVLQRFGRFQRDFMMSGPHRELTDPRERVLRYLEWMVEVGRMPLVLQGCPVGCVGQELARANPQLREAAAATLSDWTSAVEGDLRAAKRAYAPRARWSPAEVAEHLVACFQGGLLLVRVLDDDQALSRSLEQYRRYVAGLLADG